MKSRRISAKNQFVDVMRALWEGNVDGDILDKIHRPRQILFPLAWSLVKAVRADGLKVASIWVNRDDYFGGEKYRMPLTTMRGDIYLDSHLDWDMKTAVPFSKMPSKESTGLDIYIRPGGNI